MSRGPRRTKEVTNALFERCEPIAALEPGLSISPLKRIVVYGRSVVAIVHMNMLDADRPPLRKRRQISTCVVKANLSQVYAKRFRSASEQ